MAHAMVNCPNCESQASIDSKWDRFICPHCGKQYEIAVLKGTGGSSQIELRPPSLKNARSPADYAHRNASRLSDKTRNKLQQLGFFAFGLSLVVIFSANELGCFRSITSTLFPPPTVAEMIAELDGTRNISQYQSLLQQLSIKFQVSEKTIADQTSGSVQTLKESGISESFLNIMEGMNSISHSIKGTYMDTVTAYTLLRINGNNHRETISSIETMWDQLMKIKQ